MRPLIPQKNRRWLGGALAWFPGATDRKASLSSRYAKACPRDLNKREDSNPLSRFWPAWICDRQLPGVARAQYGGLEYQPRGGGVLSGRSRLSPAAASIAMLVDSPSGREYAAAALLDGSQSSFPPPLRGGLLGSWTRPVPARDLEGTFLLTGQQTAAHPSASSFPLTPLPHLVPFPADDPLVAPSLLPLKTENRQ